MIAIAIFHQGSLVAVSLLMAFDIQLAIIVIFNFAIMLAICIHDCWHHHNHDITQNLSENVFHCDVGHDNSDGAIIAIIAVVKMAATANSDALGEKFQQPTNVPSFLKLFMPATSYLLLENGSINLIFMQTATVLHHFLVNSCLQIVWI